MKVKTIEVLDPTVPPKIKKAIKAIPIPKLDNKIRIRFLWNSKPNGDILLSSIMGFLSHKFPLASMSWQQKVQASAPANSATIKDLATNSDLVITAIMMMQVIRIVTD